MTNIAKITRSGVPQHRTNWVLLCGDTAHRHFQPDAISGALGRHVYRQLALVAYCSCTIAESPGLVWRDIRQALWREIT